MTRRDNLKRLLYPRHIAFIGGKTEAARIRNCRQLGYEGEIWVVNPKYEEIAGYPCYPSVADLPEPPDAAFIGIRRERAIEAVRELAAVGAGGCVAHAAGFAELGPDGKLLQDELIRATGEMALVGPNCQGFLNYLDGAALWPDLHGGGRVEQGVAVISQSGNVSLNATMADRSLSIGHVLSIGNQAVLGVGDYVDVLLDDPRVPAIGMYIEGIEDVDGFSRAAARALRKGVPLVALKSGSSEPGSRLTMSHTSSLSTPDELYDALFERLGIVRADSLPSFLETLKLLAVSGPLERKDLAVLGASGGDSALLADLMTPLGFRFPDFGDEQRKSLKEQLGDFVSVSNPLDYNTAIWGDRDKVERCFTTAMRGDFDAAVLTLDYPKPGCGDREAWDVAADSLVAASKSTGVPAFVASTLPELLPQEVRERLLAGGVIPLQGLREAVSALRAAVWYGERRREIPDEGSAEALPPSGPGNVPEKPQLLDEWDSKRRLAGFGLRVPEGRITSSEDAPEAASEIGFPVAVKRVAPGLAHKSELGAVELNLDSTQAVKEAAERIGTAGRVNGNGRYLVERMAKGAVAELIVGLKRDPRFGLALVIGSGGTLVELVEDTATVLLPARRSDVSRALDSLKAASLLDGYRGKPEGDREAAIDAILAVATFARKHRDRIQELDVNPLLVLRRGEGVVVADALIRMQPE